VQTLEINPQTEIEGVTVNRFDNRVAPDMSFSKLLQSVMLKDPNVLLVAQVPDTATADLITKYGLTESTDGKRVFASLSSQDTFTTIEGWLQLNSNKAGAISSLRAIIAQRLVRILCPTCKIPYQPDEVTMKKLNLPVGRNLQSFKANTEPIVDRKGNSITCPDCGGVGYKGRTGIFEVLVVTDEMKKILASGGGINQVKALARKNNQLLLVEHGIRKFATGVTAIHEVTRVLTPPAASSGSAAGKTSIVKQA
jgi:general secretion pathway protein E